jgi:hypothetical protein
MSTNYTGGVQALSEFNGKSVSVSRFVHYAVGLAAHSTDWFVDIGCTQVLTITRDPDIVVLKLRR